MCKSSIILRPAEQLLEEGLTFAHYLDIAAEGFFTFMLGQKSKSIIAKSYLETGHDYSYEHVLFAELDHQIVGMAAGFTSQQHQHFSHQPLKKAAGYRVWRMMTVKILFAPMMRLIDTINDGDFYLMSIATDANLRGSGIGSRLMDAMEQRAVSSGCQRFALDVSGDNAGARKLYQRRGMVIESKWPRRIPIPKIKFYRMVKNL